MSLDPIDSPLLRKMERNDPIQVAKALKALSSQKQMTQSALAERMGKKRSTIANYLRLLTLPHEIQRGLSHGTISMAHAKILLSISSEISQQALFRRIISERLTVRQTEKTLSQLSIAHKGDEALHMRALAEKLQTHLGTQVEIKGSGANGQISLRYYDLDDLERLLERLGIGADSD